MLTGDDVKVLDKNAEFIGTPTETLMENAGKNVAAFIEKNFKKENILIFCGLGNNGGDGFVAARYLAKQKSVTIFLTGKKKNIRSSISKKNFEKLQSLPLTIYDIDSLSKLDELIKNATLIVDAMLGVGLSGDLRQPYLDIVNKINNATDKKIIAVDVPTGMGMKTSLNVDHTLTFHDKKYDMDVKSCGEIHVAEIGIPSQAETYVGPGELSVYYPRPRKESHKGDNGRVLIVGGGPFTGAPALSGLAALATGADLVFIASPVNISSVVSGYSPNLIIKPLESEKILTAQDVDYVIKLAESVDTVIIGPGLGSSPETLYAVRLIVSQLKEKSMPMVVDADGITAFVDNHDLIKNSLTVLTPHAAEFKRFTGKILDIDNEKRISQVMFWAKKLGISIFLKGSIDIVSDGSSYRLNKVHNEAMTVGGTGDVLTGVIGALLSKGVSLFHAMRVAAFLNGMAGNFAFDKKSYGLAATDIIEEIPNVLIEYL